MAEEKSSGFFFDVRKWKSSRDVQRMSYAARGVYFDMMCEQWEKRNLPDDRDAVAQELALTESHAAEIRDAWPVVRPKFTTSKGAPDRIYNDALEQTRRKQRKNERQRSEAGRRGGLQKAANRRKDGDLSPSKARAPLGVAVAKGSDLTRQDRTRSDRTSTGAPNVWARILAHIETTLSRHEFHTWFKKTTLVSARGSVLRVAAPDVHATWIDKHHAKSLAEAIAAVRPGARVEWCVSAAKRSA